MLSPRRVAPPTLRTAPPRSSEPLGASAQETVDGGGVVPRAVVPGGKSCGGSSARTRDCSRWSKNDWRLRWQNMRKSSTVVDTRHMPRSPKSTFRQSAHSVIHSSSFSQDVVDGGARCPQVRTSRMERRQPGAAATGCPAGWPDPATGCPRAADAAGEPPVPGVLRAAAPIGGGTIFAASICSRSAAPTSEPIFLSGVFRMYASRPPALSMHLCSRRPVESARGNMFGPASLPCSSHHVWTLISRPAQLLAGARR